MPRPLRAVRFFIARPRRGRGGRPDAPRPHGGSPTTAAVALGGARRARRGSGARYAHGRGVVPPPRRGRSRRGGARGRSPPPPPERWGVEPNADRRSAAAPPLPSPSPSPRAAAGWGAVAAADAGGSGTTTAPRLLRAGRPADVTVSPPRRPRRQTPVARLAAAPPAPARTPAPPVFCGAVAACHGGRATTTAAGKVRAVAPEHPHTTRRTATAQGRGRGGEDWLPSRMHRRDGKPLLRLAARRRLSPRGGRRGVGGGGMDPERRR